MLRIYVRENDSLAPHDVQVSADPSPDLGADFATPPPASSIVWIDLLNPTP